MICYSCSCSIHTVLRRNTFLHILPTLVNLQWDDQLNRAGDFIPFWGAEYNGAYHSISSLYELFDDSPFPHVTWTDVFLQQGNVSSPKLGRCLLLPDFMVTPQRRKVLNTEANRETSVATENRTPMLQSSSPQPSYYNELAGWRNRIKDSINSGKEGYYSGQQEQSFTIIFKSLNIWCIQKYRFVGYLLGSEIW